MKLYHLTTEENINSILKNGLQPKIGNNSAACHEIEPAIYLSDKQSLPYWYILTGQQVLIEVNITDTSALTQYDYHDYQEYMVKQPIESSHLKRIKLPKTMNAEKYMKCMRELCESYIWTFSALCAKTCRYYDCRDEWEEKYAKEYKENIMYSIDGLLNTVTKRLDYSVLTQKEIKAILRECGDGNYAFTDHYYNEHKRLYNKIKYFEKDDLHPYLMKLSNYIRDTFKDCLQIDTGGWCL